MSSGLLHLVASKISADFSGVPFASIIRVIDRHDDGGNK
jgi:hypothetical protein